MAQLPTIYTIQASDAPQHSGKLQEILQNLKTENRIGSFTTVKADEEFSSITDTIQDEDLILVVLTNQLDSQRERIEAELKTLKEAQPGIRIGEIIVDNVPYENEFITFPSDLRNIREREDMDSVWSGIGQSLRDMFPAKMATEPVPPVSSIDWPKYLKIAGILLGVVLVIFIIWELADGDGESGRVEAVEQATVTEDTEPVVEEDETEPAPTNSALSLDLRNLGSSRLMDQRIANFFSREGIRAVRAVPSGNYCSDARPAILEAGTYRAPVSFLSTASPGALNRCNGVPLEFEFSTPVREVTIHFYGAASNYLLVPYDENGRRLGSASAQGSPYNYERPFVVSYTSGSADISSITFGHQTALTMVLSLTATR